MHIHHTIMMVIQRQEGKCQRCFASGTDIHLCTPHIIPERSEGHATESKLLEASISRLVCLDRRLPLLPDLSGVCLRLWLSSGSAPLPEYNAVVPARTCLALVLPGLLIIVSSVCLLWPERLICPETYLMLMCFSFLFFFLPTVLEIKTQDLAHTRQGLRCCAPLLSPRGMFLTPL